MQFRVLELALCGIVCLILVQDQHRLIKEVIEIPGILLPDYNRSDRSNCTPSSISSDWVTYCWITTFLLLLLLHLRCVRINLDPSHCSPLNYNLIVIKWVRNPQLSLQTILDAPRRGGGRAEEWVNKDYYSDPTPLVQLTTQCRCAALAGQSLWWIAWRFNEEVGHSLQSNGHFSRQ